MPAVPPRFSHARPPRTRRRLALIVAGLAAALALAAILLSAGSASRPAAGAAPAAAPVAAPSAAAPLRSHARAVEPVAGDVSGATAVAPAAVATRRPSRVRGASAATAPSPGAPSIASIKRALRGSDGTAGGTTMGGRVLADGQAIAPLDAPDAVRAMVNAGNMIARQPYKWGGGHGRWLDHGYDCSGSVSFALASAGLLDAPLASGQLARWGKAGRGRWVTLYANAGHVFMVVAGMRFDTSGLRQGSRWQPTGRGIAGFSVRHPVGL
jgi:cell wall-associated NlpC family hydrolase